MTIPYIDLYKMLLDIPVHLFFKCVCPMTQVAGSGRRITFHYLFITHLTSSSNLKLQPQLMWGIFYWISNVYNHTRGGIRQPQGFPVTFWRDVTAYNLVCYVWNARENSSSRTTRIFVAHAAAFVFLNRFNVTFLIGGLIVNGRNNPSRIDE